MLRGCRITSSPRRRATTTVSSSLASSTTIMPSMMSRGSSRHVASSVRPAWNAGMTTTMRLPLSTGERGCRGRQAKRDEMSVFECGRPEALAQRRLAMRGVGSDVFGAAAPGLHIRLLPDDVIDAMRRERRGLAEMYGVTEAELGSLRNLAGALADAQPGEEAGDDRPSAQALP